MWQLKLHTRCCQWCLSPIAHEFFFVAKIEPQRATISANMQPIQLIIFDDGRATLGPMTDCRAVFELRTGTQTTQQRIERVIGQKAASLIVPAHLEALLNQRAPVPVNPNITEMSDTAWLVVNGRCAGDCDISQSLRLPLDAAWIAADGELVAAHLSHDSLAQWLARGLTLPQHIVKRPVDNVTLLQYPWDILNQLESALEADFAANDVPLADDGAEFGQFRRATDASRIESSVGQAFEHSLGNRVAFVGQPVVDFVAVL